MLIILLIAIPVVVATAVVVVEYSDRNKEQLRHHYLQTILLRGFHLERYSHYLSYWGSNRTRRVAAEVIAHLSPLIYRLDEEPLIELDRRLSLGRFLLRAAKRSKGNRRALYLLLLSNIPSETLTIAKLAEFSHDKNRMVRFFALATTINIDKANFVHHVASYPTPITQFELSYLIGVLRRGAITASYPPLLASSCYNLNLLGVAIIKEFGIESASHHLFELLEKSTSHHLRLEILYTLAAIESLECHHAIRREVSRLSPNERHCFLRHLASTGYSEQMIAFFTSTNEREYFHSITNSYKVKIECY